jgi:N-acetylglucosaminyldiphosphoundecaprenol N-acetyl-beta-D-mannosaminyltransferase
MDWGLKHIPAYVCFANVHMTMEAHQDPAFKQMLDRASLVLADGKPLTIACRLLYKQQQERIAGMDFMPRIIEVCHQQKATIFLYGSTTEVLDLLQKKIQTEYPGVKIGGAISPPFGRTLTVEEQQQYIDQINESGAHLVFVALGCPRQEKWMANNYTKINAVLLGIGGALPVMAGVQKRSPVWMQKMALEWLYRLFQEPKRMFKRYLYTNSAFIWLFFRAWFTKNKHEASA